MIIAEYNVLSILELVTPVFRERLFENFCVKIGTLKLQTFKRSIECACCGKKGIVFRLEASSDCCAHLNLYTSEGILMCTDHIIPLSKGGPHRLFNTQTMCETCNKDKADLIQPRYFNIYVKRWMHQKNISLEELRREKERFKQKNGRSY